jgi:hypothetical protein
MRLRLSKWFYLRVLVALVVGALLLWIGQEGVSMLVLAVFLVIEYRETHEPFVLLGAVIAALLGSWLIWVAIQRGSPNQVRVGPAPAVQAIPKPR